MSEPIRLKEWLDRRSKWLHVRLQPPTESHDVTINRCDGTLPRKGPIYDSIENIDFASDALVTDVRYIPPDSEIDPIQPEFSGGHFTVTLQLPTIQGVTV